MIKSISYWSVEGGLEAKCPINVALGKVKSAGFEGLELCIGEQGVLTPATSEADCCTIRGQSDASGLVVETLASGMTWGCCPSHPDPAVRRKSIQLHKDALQRAAWLGCKSMLFVPGAIIIPWDPSYPFVSYKDGVKWARQAVGALARTAEKVKVELCVENVWNGLFYSPLEFAAFIDSFESRYVKAYFDVGNVLGYHQRSEDWINLLGKRIGRVHIKDFKRSVGNLSGFCDLTEGDVAWPAVVAALKKIGYKKTLVAEMIPPTPGVLERTKAALDKIVAM